METPPVSTPSDATAAVTPTYSLSNSPRPATRPGFTMLRPSARSSNVISLSYTKEDPSGSGDIHSTIDRDCYHDGLSTVIASGMVDDDVSIEAPGIPRKEELEPGSLHSFYMEGNAPEGTYRLCVEHYNIESHESGNASVLTGSISPIEEVILVPDDNTETECNDCSCALREDNDGGEEETAARSSNAQPAFGTSSGGSGVVRSANARHMRFAFSFGTFRGMGHIPTGQLELTDFDYTPTLLTPAAMSYKHPLAAALVPQSERLARNEIFSLVDGASHTDYMVSGDGSGVFAVGASRKRSKHIHFVPILSTAKTVACNLNSADAAYLRVSGSDGSATFYDLATNEFVVCVTEDGAVLSGRDKLAILRDENGCIRQVWNYWDGLADIVPASDGNGFTISLYLPAQITPPAAEGALYTVTGEPSKTFTISGDAEAQTLTIRERESALPESMPDHVTTWSRCEGGWNMVRGEGEEAIAETRERVALSGAGRYRIITTTSRGGVVASCVSEEYVSSVRGEQCVSRTEGYGSDAARTTEFSYDEAGRLIRRVDPDGGVHTTTYDAQGRVSSESSPWADGLTRVITTTYRESPDYRSDPASIVESLVINATGRSHTLRTDTYSYSEASHMRRVEIRSSAAGSADTRLRIEDSWLATADNIHARGRLRMTQAENGVQTWYEYAPTTEHGALYTETRETRINNEAVPSHSTRSIRYISAAGNTMRAEEWALLYNGEWARTSGETCSYDVQNRRIATAKDNGRSSSRSLTCMGQPLHEVDEDGIRTDYAYDSARQLVEITRAEVRDGDTTITPETITEYTRDALGRILSTKVHTGSMVTESSRSYDAAGRISSETDTYGSTTTYAYSADGLTTTATQADGATRISTRHAGGRLAAEGGTAQPARRYSYSIENGCLCTRTMLGDGETIISEEHSNGFGDIVLSKQAVPGGGFVCTRSSYNAKGQLTRRQQDTGLAADSTPLNAMAPTLYSYHSFGELAREVVDLRTEAQADEEPGGISNSRLSIHTHSKLREADGGIYHMHTTTRNNALGSAYSESTSTLISALDATLESKTIHTDPRGKVRTSWVERGTGPLRTQKQQLPTSSLTATARVVDGFVTTQTDTAGVTTSQSRSYGTGGMTLTQTDARGNVSSTHYDLLGRVNAARDATGAYTNASYRQDNGLLLFTVDELRNGTQYRYNLQGLKIAEWGTNTQPATFGYDAEGRLTRLTTFRVNTGDIETDPSDRTDGDSTLWAYDPASGLELSKTYADGSSITKTYDAFGRLATETNARGVTKTFSYLSTTGELAGIVYSDAVTPAQAFTYTLTGKLASVTDAAGTRAFTYNEYDELVSDCLTVDGDEQKHLITENRDAFGRSSGFAYSKDGVSASAEQYGYANDGRLSSAAFNHDGEWKSFGYNYLPGTHLLQTLSMPNGMTFTQQYEPQRDLLTGMEYNRGETAVVQRYYTYDAARRPLTRQQNRQGGTRSDSFTHNNRNELTAATLGSAAYSYAYDNIGNRKTAQEDAETATAYTANALNQYTAVGSFTPAYDADGNQTRVQTSTGIWNVTYNAENRPRQFTRSNADGTTTRITCAYDFMGRRATKKVETITAGTPSTDLHQRCLYRGYLQIACCDLTRENHPHLWFITWDPTQPIATRPLALRKDATWYTYGWDLTKNICEVFGADGLIKTTYSYTPYGAVTAEGTATQFIQWSSEFHDDELGLVYYNARHFNTLVGRWINRDLIEELGGENLYSFVKNQPMFFFDKKGYKFEPLAGNGGQVHIVSSFGDRSLGKTEYNDNTAKIEGSGFASPIKYYGKPTITIRRLSRAKIQRYKVTVDFVVEHERKHARAHINAWNSVVYIANWVEEARYGCQNDRYSTGIHLLKMCKTLARAQAEYEHAIIDESDKSDVNPNVSNAFAYLTSVRAQFERVKAAYLDANK